jgi:anti-sigma B factor antagonist/stage II sporulation protein AA (anti-sigma F factor antagonist)
MVVGLNVQEQEVNGIKILRLEGRIDAVSSAVLEKKLEENITHQRICVALDFTKVDYLSSAGMRLLLSMTKKFKQKEGMLGIFAIHDNVMEIIKMAGFERILFIYPLEKEAIAALSTQKH